MSHIINDIVSDNYISDSKGPRRTTLVLSMARCQIIYDRKLQNFAQQSYHTVHTHNIHVYITFVCHSILMASHPNIHLFYTTLNITFV